MITGTNVFIWFLKKMYVKTIRNVILQRQSFVVFELSASRYKLFEQQTATKSCRVFDDK